MKRVYESDDKMINPKHYQSANGLEVIDVIKAFTDGLNGIEATDTGNIIKYACRWKNKNGIQDLEKILWYTQHLINHLKNQFGLLEREESHEKPDEFNYVNITLSNFEIDKLGQYIKYGPFIPDSDSLEILNSIKNPRRDGDCNFKLKVPDRVAEKISYILYKNDIVELKLSDSDVEILSKNLSTDEMMLIVNCRNRLDHVDNKTIYKVPKSIKDRVLDIVQKKNKLKDRMRKINSSNDVELTLFDSEVCALSAILSENEISYFNSKTFTSVRNFEKDQTMFIVPEDFARRILELLANITPA